MKYVSGPMRGRKRFNFDQFYECEAWLNEHGHQAHNPARIDEENYGFNPDETIESQGFDIDAAMARDLAFIVSPECTGVVLLPEWELSVGARWEAGAAQLLNKPVHEWVKDDDMPSGWTTRLITKRIVCTVTKDHEAVAV